MDQDSSDQAVTLSESGSEAPQSEASQLSQDRKPKSRIGRIIKDPDTLKIRILDEDELQTDPSALPENRFVLAIEEFETSGSYRQGDSKRMNIYSPHLRRLFQEVIKYHPSITFGKLRLSFPEPYSPLFHYWPKLCDAVYHSSEQSTQCVEDFKVLERWYSTEIKSEFDRVRDSLSQGLIQFDDLWSVFQPGDRIFSRNDFNKPQFYVLISIDIQSTYSISQQRITYRFYLRYWWVSWDPSTGSFTRSHNIKAIEEFAGSRPITSLPFYPICYYNEKASDSIQSLLDFAEQRGRHWQSIVSKPPSCYSYSGLAEDRSNHKRQTLSGRVIVDPNEIPLDSTVALQLSSKSFADREEDRRPLSMKGSGYDNSYIDFDEYSKDEKFSTLQAQVATPTVVCFSIDRELWFSIDVQSLSPVEWRKTAFDHLVLDKSSKDLLKGLVEQHKKNEEKLMGDVIESKGMGVVIILHGPPGVGKTLTAESVSELTSKPLLQVKINDIVGDGQQSSSSSYSPYSQKGLTIEEVFRRASRWDAVLLLDEADVILEKRALEDFKRNAVVSAFLRALEYYKGILFMTTNRIQTMDMAFQSRIHISIRYRPLVPEVRREIWTNFIDRLEASESRAKRELKEHLDDLQEWELNGRQIRNVLMIAQSLSLSRKRRSGALNYADVEEVANRTIEFQDFFDEDRDERKGQLGGVSGRRLPEYSRR